MAAAERLNVPIEQAIVVGDAIWDMLTAGDVARWAWDYSIGRIRHRRTGARSRPTTL